MALDTRRPKGYRHSWNGGKPPAETQAERDFYAHLDACQQCRDHPFDLCVTGARMMAEAIKRPEGQ